MISGPSPAKAVDLRARASSAPPDPGHPAVDRVSRASRTRDEMSARIPGRARTSRMRRRVERDRLRRPEHVDAVAARARHDRDVREDRGERPDVVLNSSSGPPYGTHCIMIPPSGQVVAAGLVVLARRDDRGARALDRRRRVGDDDVVALVGQLEVVPTVGDDDLAVRVRRGPPRRPGSSSRTSSARTARARRRRSAARRSAPPGTPSPSRTRRPARRVDSGRAISGRIGISLASTVSSVIDVPATQSSGVER